MKYQYSVIFTRLFLVTTIWFVAQSPIQAQGLPINEDDRVCLIGNEMALGMAESGFWETLLQSRWTEANLSVRCLGNSGYSMQLDATPLGFESQDEALRKYEAAIIFAAFAPGEDAPTADQLKPQLENWLKHLRGQKYNGDAAPSIVLVSSTPCENTGDASLSARLAKGNTLRQSYSSMMREVAGANGVGFIDGYGLLSDKFLGSNKRSSLPTQSTSRRMGTRHLGQWSTSTALERIPTGK
ncbi:MAG: hypothetical protein R3F19_09450 [Verrucomicrobiales bacterium]